MSALRRVLTVVIISGDLNNGLDRIGDEALLMRQVMQPLLVRRSRELFSAVSNSRVKNDRAYPGDTALVFGHHAHRFVMVAVDLETLLIGEIQIRQHMTARNCRNKCLLRID